MPEHPEFIIKRPSYSRQQLNLVKPNGDTIILITADKEAADMLAGAITLGLVSFDFARRKGN